MKVQIVKGDITKFNHPDEVCAVVNAANEYLLGGGGVDGAIHKAAGPELVEFCRTIEVDEEGVRCYPGETHLTPGFNMGVDFIIHTVGPRFNNSDGENKELQLFNCFFNSLVIAEDEGIEHIAFPAISCGVFGGEIHTLAKIAYNAINRIPWDGTVKTATFYLFNPGEYMMFKRIWEAMSY